MYYITSWPDLFCSRYRRPLRNFYSFIVIIIVIVGICAISVHSSRIGGDLGHELEDGHGNYAFHRILPDVSPEPNGVASRRELYNSIEVKPGSPTPSKTRGSVKDVATCSIVMQSRSSLLQTNSSSSTGRHANITETALLCSHMNRRNYKEMIMNTNSGNESPLHQLHIVSSDASIVGQAIDLICSKYDCSQMTVFNATEVHYIQLGDFLASWPRLEVLDLTETNVPSIQSILPVAGKPEAGILRNLTHLYLDENELGDLDFNLILDRMPNLKYLSVVNNFINNIFCSESLRPRLESQLDTINLAGSSINCDKSQLWFLRLLQDPLTNFKFPDNDHIKCSKPENLADMTWAQRLSVHETKICDSCVCRSLKKTAISVDCHNKNLTTLPDVLPPNTRILNFTSNRITSLSVPLNSKNWENVTYVHLENNLISSFQQLEVNSKFMRNLAALDIRRNRFQEFPGHILEQFINLDQVHLSNNPWLCDCESAFAFQEWLQRQFHKVGDKEEIRCGVPGNEENGLRSISLKQRLSYRVIYKLPKSELCPQDSLEEPYDWLDIVNLILGITIILIVTKVIMDYLYQRRTKRLPNFFRLNI